MAVGGDNMFKSKEKKLKNSSNMGLGIALGITFGAAYKNLGVGLALGVALGVALDYRKNKKEE